MLAQLSSAGKRLALATIAAVGLAIPANAVTINGAGATFPNPIYSKWIQTYNQAHPDVQINYQSVGSGAGIAQYKAGTVDFGASDAAVSDANLATFPQATMHVPTVAGAVVLAYHIQGIGPGLKLTGDVIADIFLGKITTWNDARIQGLNPAITLPASAIATAHRADGSGTTNIFTTYLSAVSPDWKAKIGAGTAVDWPVGAGGKGNPGVAELVAQTEGGIGYVELAYAVENHLAYGPVKNARGSFVLASPASTTAAIAASAKSLAQDVRFFIGNSNGRNAYPICGFTYLLVPKEIKDADKREALVSFLKWAVCGPGQEMVESLLYAPLPPAVAKVDAEEIASIK